MTSVTSYDAQSTTELLRRSLFGIWRDPVLRRHLRYEPPRALEELGLAGPMPTGGLPVRIRGLSARIDDATLLGSGSEGAQRESLPLEVRLVAYGLRPAALIALPSEQVGGVMFEARRVGLVALVCPEEFEPLAEPTKGGFADTAVRSRAVGSTTGSGDGIRWWRRVVVSYSTDIVVLAWLAQLFKWDSYLGLLLGYPCCCADAFQKRWPEAYARHRGDLATMLVDAGKGDSREHLLPWQTNVYARYFGDVLVSHFPCQLKCGATIAQANRMFGILLQLERAAAVQLQIALAAPLLISRELGVFRLEEASVEYGSTSRRLRYSSVKATCPGSHRVTEALNAACQIEVTADKDNNVCISGTTRRLTGQLLCFTSEDLTDAIPRRS
jgi:hypothetical protein